MPDFLPFVVIGFAVGLASGAAYLLVLHGCVRCFVRRRRAFIMLATAPARVAIPVLGLLLMGFWSRAALLAAAAGLLCAQALIVGANGLRKTPKS